MATDFGALVRASPPVDLVMRLGEVAERMERTRSWMIPSGAGQGTEAS